MSLSLILNSSFNRHNCILGDMGSQPMTNCHRLKLPEADGKMQFIDVATAENLLRLIPSVPSQNNEPIKFRLAKVGFELLQDSSFSR